MRWLLSKYYVLGRFGSVIVCMAPLAVVESYPVEFLSLNIWDRNPLCAGLFVVTGLSLLLCWRIRTRAYLPLTGLVLLLFAWAVIDYRIGQSNIHKAAQITEGWARGFPLMLVKYHQLGRGWYTLSLGVFSVLCASIMRMLDERRSDLFSDETPLARQGRSSEGLDPQPAAPRSLQVEVDNGKRDDDEDPLIMEDEQDPIVVRPNIAVRCLRWISFIPVGWLAGVLAGLLIWLPFAAPYLLFGKLAGLAIYGIIGSSPTFVYTFLLVAWLIAPTKSKVEAWLILIVACLISTDLLFRATSFLNVMGAPLLGAIIGCIHVIRFYFSACRGKGKGEFFDQN